MSMDRRHCLKTIALASCGALGIAGCKSAPMTGRRQLMLMPENQELTLGEESYQEVVASEPPSQNPKFVQLVERVGQKIAQKANRPDYDWEFRVIASPTQNAFCLPGGKVAVYEGILPVCENEAGLAVVMSHEVAHALARHGGERMSQNMAVDNAKLFVNKVMQNQDETRRDLFLQAYGVATQYGVLLPYNRRQESEADHIGLMLMADAGYDPAEAPRFWRRFSGAKDGSQTPEFLSTHPSDERRASDLEALLPESSERYDMSERIGIGERLVRRDRTQSMDERLA